jgi:hypothetical protein
MLHHEVDEIILEDNIVQFNNVLMPSVIELSQVAQRGDLTAQQVPRDFVVDRSEIDGLDGYSVVRLAPFETQIDVAC